MVFISYLLWCGFSCVISVLCQHRNPNDCFVEVPKLEFLNDTIVEYYVNLIRTELEKTETYQLPTNNDYFLEGSDSESQNIDFGEYDFIIVGAGSAGSPLAYGLSEKEDWKVLLIEAGGEETDFSYIPAFDDSLLTSRMNWGYNTTPQEYTCKTQLNSKCLYPRGKVKGGSGAINGLAYVRGNKEDYDVWASEGNPGWSYDDVLPYFIKQERSRIHGDPGYHGTHGLLSVDIAEPRTPLQSIFLNANKEVGRRIVDYNGAQQIGAALAQSNIINGRRASGGSVYLSRAKCRENFKISTESLVTKVLVDDSKRAYGVEFIRFGRNYTATASKEVILSAGTINTPQLLLLSGIGPEEDLTELGIEVVQNLPGVGRNMEEYAAVLLDFTTNLTAFNSSSASLTRKYLAGFGPYTQTHYIQAHAFIKLQTSKLPPGVPDIQFIYYLTAPDISTSLVQNSFTILTGLLRPKSKGSVRLTSKSPLQFPAIDPNVLSEEEDRQTLYEGCETALNLTETESYRKVNATFVPQEVPECDQYEFRSRDYWFCYLKYFALPFYHPTSSAAMGIGPETVVDHRLRVRGIKNLRVADCSIMPHIPSGNTNAPAFMVGFKASDIIKEDYADSAL